MSRERTEPQLITCGHCFNLLNDPITLECQHSFCFECLRSKLDRPGVAEGVLCELCGTAHPAVSLRNLREYIDQPLISHIMALNKGVDGRPQCQWCDEAMATIQCQECLYVLCNECNLAVHKNSAKRNHQPFSLTDARAVKTMAKKCQQRGHEEYRMEFYCARCEELCCAYCLQVGPHKQHESVPVGKAAQEARQQMGRDLEQMSQVKARIESMANDLNRVTAQYNETYDHVESLLTDRFAVFRQTIMQREMEVRKMMLTMRESGDRSLSTARTQFLQKLNSINEAGLQYRRLQNGGADYEVLQNRAMMSAFLKMDVPQVSGTGFRVTDVGDLSLTGLVLSLDLSTANGVSNGAGGDMGSAYGGSQAPSRGVSEMPRSMAAAPTPAMTRSGQLPSSAYRFTFPVDQDVEVIERSDGVLYRCISRVPSSQVGLRSNETFEQMRRFSEDGSTVTWKVRLEMIAESFIGIVEKTDSTQVPEGFYWIPTKTNVYDGRAGRVSTAMRSLPPCKNSDVVKFVYDIGSKTLRVAINGVDRGIIVSELHPFLCPCFIFRPGESLTLLY